MARIGHLEAVKIQARAVAPIARALEKELGRQRAHELIGEAIATSWADFQATRQKPDAGDHPRGTAENAFPVESEVVQDTDDMYAVNMTHCEFADYFRSIGEPEIGALLTCGVDFEMTRRFNPGWRLIRTQTLMMGADHCDFCWKRADGGQDDDVTTR